MRTPPADVVAAAQAAQTRWGVPASVSIGQWALESAWGAKATGRFNFFGVKAVAGQAATMCWTHEVVDGRSTACQALFRDYASLEQAFDAHAALLCGPRFAAAQPHKADATAFVRAIAPVYATDPHYADNLLNLIRVDGFAAYDQAAPGPGGFGAAVTRQALEG